MKVFYRAEVIGSMLRPSWLREARQAFQKGEIPALEFKPIEDRAVDQAITLQEASGVDVVTDGELRRASFLGPLTDCVDGFTLVPVEQVGAQQHWQASELEPKAPVMQQIPVISSKLRRRRSLVTEEFAYARARAHKPLKATLPSPLMLALLWSPKHSSSAYPEPFELFADAVDILREEVRELVKLGCGYIQIDAPELATLVDPDTRKKSYEDQGISTERMLGEGIEMLNAVADASGVKFGLHLCRGNNAGHWMSSGGYEAISQQVFKRAKPYEIFLLEYDNWRSGTFEPLADVPRDKRVVLGLVSTKTDQLEPKDGLAARIEEAARHFPRQQLALSTQCGFASVLEGNPIREETQLTKLKLVAEVAHSLWPNLG